MQIILGVFPSAVLSTYMGVDVLYYCCRDCPPIHDQLIFIGSYMYEAEIMISFMIYLKNADGFRLPGPALARDSTYDIFFELVDSLFRRILSSRFLFQA